MMAKKGFDRKVMGRKICRLRTERGFSQAELARRAGCSPHHISRLESGACGMSARMFLCLCWALECLPSAILAVAE